MRLQEEASKTEEDSRKTGKELFKEKGGDFEDLTLDDVDDEEQQEMAEMMGKGSHVIMQEEEEKNEEIPGDEMIGE